jgi:hypothetical protein
MKTVFIINDNNEVAEGKVTKRKIAGNAVQGYEVTVGEVVHFRKPLQTYATKEEAEASIQAKAIPATYYVLKGRLQSEPFSTPVQLSQTDSSLEMIKTLESFAGKPWQLMVSVMHGKGEKPEDDALVESILPDLFASKYRYRW